MAYGSDALGGVIHARTRRVDPTADWGFRFIGAAGAGTPELRGGMEVSKGLGRGGVLLQAHARQFEDYRSPEGEVVNSGASDQGFLGRFEYTFGPGVLTAGWQSDFGRDIERPRNNSNVTRFYYPTEDSHRFTASYDMYRVAGFSRMTFSGFLGSYAQVTDQDKFPTQVAPRAIERADVSSRDYQVRATAEKLAGDTKFEVGVDVNGRAGLHALDIKLGYDMQGDQTSETTNVSIDTAHRTDAGVYATAETALLPQVTVAGGGRVDSVAMENEGGYFGDRTHDSTAPCRASRRLTAGSLPRLQPHRPGVRAASATRRSRTATTAGRPGGATSPATPTSSPRRACSSTPRCAMPPAATAGRSTRITTASPTSSSATRRRRTTSSSATAGRPASGASSWKARPSWAEGSRWSWPGR